MSKHLVYCNLYYDLSTYTPSQGDTTRLSGFTQLERYEAKFHITSDMLPTIKQAIKQRCTLDVACQHGPYKISSLYLDGPRYPLYQATMLKAPRRFKLRVRAYQNHATFFEIKRRIKSVIYKSRVAVPYKTWPQLLLDPLALAEYAQQLDPQRGAILHEFVHRYLKVHAQAQTIVEYTREAYEGADDEYVRITIDRDIKACYMPDYRVYFSDPSTAFVHHPQQSHLHHSQEIITHDLSQRYQPWYPIDVASRFQQQQAGMVLEIKTRYAFPLWISDLIQRLNLSWHGFSKYGNAVEAIHPHLPNFHTLRLSHLDRIKGV